MSKKTYNNNKINLETYKVSGLSYSLLVGIPLFLALAFTIVIGVLQISATKIVAGVEVQKDWYIYVSFLLPQIALALTAVICAKYSKTSVREKAKEQLCKPKYFLLAILAQIGMLSLSELNTLFLTWLGKFGYQSSEIQIPSLDGFGLFGALFVIALLPAIMEELVFRGILLNGLKKSFSDWGAALICGGLFALFHQNPAQTPYQFCCGTVYALIAIKAGSILPTVISHFINNAAIILLYKFGITGFDKTTSIIIICISLTVLIGVLAWLFVFEKKERGEREKKGRKPFFLYAAFGIGISALSWILTLFNGL